MGPVESGFAFSDSPDRTITLWMPTLPSPAPLAGLALRCQSDSRLAALAREGQARAFEEIVRRYREPLVSFATAILLPLVVLVPSRRTLFVGIYELVLAGIAIGTLVNATTLEHPIASETRRRKKADQLRPGSPARTPDST